MINTTSPVPHEDIQLPGASKVIFLILGFIFFCTGLLSNLLVLYTFTAVKRLHVSHNVFVVSLSIVDTIIIGYLLPFNLYTLLNGHQPPSDNLCYVNATVAHVCFTTSVQTIMAIAIDRYVSVCHKHKYKKHFSSPKIVTYVICSWSIGPIFSLPLYFGKRKFIYDPTLQMCIFDRYGDFIYTAIYQTLCLAVPIVVTMFCYLSVYKTVHQTRNQLARHWNNGLQRQRVLYEILVTRSQFAVFIAYLILYFPFGITAVFITRRDMIPVTVHALTIYLCYMNSCINAIIYGVLNGNIRRAYKEAMPCLRRSMVTVYPTESTSGFAMTTPVIRLLVKNSQEV